MSSEAAAAPVRAWRSGDPNGRANENITLQVIDALRRPAAKALTHGTARPRVVELRGTSPLSGAPATERLAGRLFQHVDSSGLMEVGGHDLRGAAVGPAPQSSR